jgi:pimeloyl-ACP methyl ester carboxylesterase
MPVISVRGVNISFHEYGSGEPIVLLTGTGGYGRGWTVHQVPAMTSGGYRSITVDNRGVPPSDVGPEGFTLDDMVEDVAGLIAALGISPCRVVGFSLGGIVTLETLVKYPGLITQAVLMGTPGRLDPMRSALNASLTELEDSGVELPPKYGAVVRAMQYLSPRTMNDERLIRDWLEMFELWPQDREISRAQRGAVLTSNRLEAYRKITSACLVIGYADDLVVPSFFCREVAESIPDCRYEEIPGCGHYGHLERPDVVNAAILKFFGSGHDPVTGEA